MKVTMDPSALRSPDQENPDHLNQDRRRNVRQKLHTPVYVSFDGPDTGIAVDLSELLDLHEEGFAVQTGERLEVNRTVTLCLDLPETKSYIHGSGQVVWSDETGRGGIRFSALSDSSQQILRQWLFANLLIASNSRVARTAHSNQHGEEKILRPVPVHKLEPETSPELSPVISIPQPSVGLSVIDAFRREIRELGDNVDAALRLVTERAQNLTGASGAALAFLTAAPTNDRMLCRARFGEPAPPLGSAVEIKQGLSGECVRSGELVSCDDMSNDERVDPEVGRALGIGSLIAAPIVSDFRVVGLLEVFSPHPRAFTQAHATILERLVELIPNIYHKTTHPEPAQTESVRFEKPQAPVSATPLADPVPEASPENPSAPPRLLYRALLGLVTVVVATVLGYVIGPVIGKRWLTSPQVAQQTSSEVVEAASTSSTQRPQAMSLAELQQLAIQGDADAQWQMGIRCHASNPPDDAQAMHWFERAADQGYVAAQATLGAYYWAGRGVPSDLSKAYMWSAIAFAGGDQNSKIRLEGLASQMTRAQISAARQQAEAWIHQHNAAKQP
jgi:GAF domain-containing protein/PilZ domain-containing protein/Sel1 repeat-containing protein